MKSINWHGVAYIAGIVLLLIGILDPLEGSVVITAGSILLALTSFLSRSSYRNAFLISAVMIVTGVAALFILSSFGGFGGNARLSWWWGLTILPYPAGWLLAVITIVMAELNRRKKMPD